MMVKRLIAAAMRAILGIVLVGSLLLAAYRSLETSVSGLAPMDPPSDACAPAVLDGELAGEHFGECLAAD